MALSTNAQTTADEVLSVAQKANDYFMKKYEDPTVPTNVKKIRPSSLWTRAVYYEGLMALQAIDPQQRYLDYALRWAEFHKWMPRNGVTTCDADDQCCGQTYVDLLIGKVRDERIKGLQYVIANLDHQMQTPNTKLQTTTPKAKTTVNSLYGWWTWIDAIQMAMPLYMQIYKVTGDKKYLNHAMQMYRGVATSVAEAKAIRRRDCSTPTTVFGGAMPTMCLHTRSPMASNAIGAEATDGCMPHWCAAWTICPEARKSSRN